MTGICEKRCFIRIYYWDGRNAELVRGEGERTMIKNKPHTLLRFKLRESGKFRLVALSTTEKFVDLANKEKKYKQIIDFFVNENKFGLSVTQYGSVSQKSLRTRQ